jgi:hypothetical protein
MEEWNSVVRNLRETSTNPKETQVIAFFIFQDLKRLKIKEKRKFVERTGSEFISWTAFMETRFDVNLVKDVINDDTFWEMTTKLAKL